MRQKSISKKFFNLLCLTLIIFISVSTIFSLVLKNTQDKLYDSLNTRTNTLNLIRALGIDMHQINSSVKSLSNLDKSSKNFKENIDLIDHNIEQIDERLTKLDSTLIESNVNDSNSKLTSLLTDFKNDYSKFKETSKQISSDTSKLNTYNELFDSTEEKIDNLGDYYVEEGQALATNQNKSNIKIIISLIVLSIIGLIIIFYKYIKTTKNISTNIKKLIDFTEEIKLGNLSNRLNIKSNDELSIISSSINDMLDNMETLISSISTASAGVYNCSNKLSQNINIATNANTDIIGSIDDLTSNSSSQIDAIKWSEANLNTLSEKLDLMAKSSSNINSIANSTNDVTSNGIKNVSNLTSTSIESKNSIKSLNSIISDIVKNSNSLNDLVHDITSISEQTNLLSLNASIEAARAGSMGAGFAVVAKEIGDLAVESSKLSNASKDQIKDIVLEINSAVESIKTLDYNFNLLDKTIVDNEKIFKDISDGINFVKSEVNKLTSNNTEILNDRDLIIQKMNDLNSLITINNELINNVYNLASNSIDSTKSVNNESDALSTLTVELNDSISKFSIKN